MYVVQACLAWEKGNLDHHQGDDKIAKIKIFRIVISCWKRNQFLSTSSVVSKGDEKNHPWNPVLCVSKEIFTPKRSTHTHTHTNTHEHRVSMLISPLLRSLHYPLALLRATRRRGRELNCLFYTDPWGSPGIHTRGPENGREPHLSTHPLLRRKRRRGGELHTHDEKVLSSSLFLQQFFIIIATTGAFTPQHSSVSFTQEAT